MSASARRTTWRSLSRSRSAASVTDGAGHERARARRRRALRPGRSSARDARSNPAWRRAAQSPTSRSATRPARPSAAHCSVAGFGNGVDQPVVCAVLLQGIERQRRRDMAPPGAALVAVEAVPERLQLGAELPIDIGGETRARRIIALRPPGGARSRIPAPHPRPRRPGHRRG